MSTSIQVFAETRPVKWLMHFTRANNLDSILARGLVLRSTLIGEGFTECNDQYRIDGTDAVCVSIGFPNYKLFYPLRQKYPQEQWVVLAIRREALWMLDCAFCSTNAASSEVKKIPISERRSVSALEAMFGDLPNKPRAELGIPDYWPTNPQAEVLILNGVPREYIFAIVAPTETVKQELAAKHPGIEISVFSGYFNGRKDYLHWK
jgi:hypothetical protein